MHMNVNTWTNPVMHSSVLSYIFILFLQLLFPIFSCGSHFHGSHYGISTYVLSYLHDLEKAAYISGCSTSYFPTWVIKIVSANRFGDEIFKNRQLLPPWCLICSRRQWSHHSYPWKCATLFLPRSKCMDLLRKVHIADHVCILLPCNRTDD